MSESFIFLLFLSDKFVSIKLVSAESTFNFFISCKFSINKRKFVCHSLHFHFSNFQVVGHLIKSRKISLHLLFFFCHINFKFTFLLLKRLHFLLLCLKTRGNFRISLFCHILLCIQVCYLFAKRFNLSCSPHKIDRFRLLASSGKRALWIDNISIKRNYTEAITCALCKIDSSCKIVNNNSASKEIAHNVFNFLVKINKFACNTKASCLSIYNAWIKVTAFHGCYWQESCPTKLVVFQEFDKHFCPFFIESHHILHCATKGYFNGRFKLLRHLDKRSDNTNNTVFQFTVSFTFFKKFLYGIGITLIILLKICQKFFAVFIDFYLSYQVCLLIFKSTNIVFKCENFSAFLA